MESDFINSGNITSMDRSGADNILAFYRRALPGELSRAAAAVCYNHYGNKIFLRGLIEFSNYCIQDCLYCGIRKSNSPVVRYRMSAGEIIAAVKQGFDRGFRTFVLQSGEDPAFTANVLCSLVEKIKEITYGKAAVTLSCGIKKKDEYRDLKEAGCDRYLLRFETSDAKLHSYLRNGVSLKARLKALSALKELGYEVGSGFMTGLPGETEKIREQNALLCKERQFDMVGIGPFIPHPATPLKQEVLQPFYQALAAVSLVRLLLPQANIPATTAAGSITPNGREEMIGAGANVLMPNITPVLYKKNYQLYPGKICLEESGFECLNCLSRRVQALGREISFERGNALSFTQG